MKYKIYELVQPDHLKRISNEGYRHAKTIERNVFEEIDYDGVGSTHNTFEEAFCEIDKNKEILKNLELTIIPVISIYWNGEIR